MHTPVLSLAHHPLPPQLPLGPEALEKVADDNKRLRLAKATS